MIKAIVFDLGGVVVNLDLEICKKTFKEVLGYNKIDEILDPYHQRGIYSDLEEGLITADEFRDAVLKDSKPGCTHADVDRCMYSLLTSIDEGKIPFINSLAGKYRLFVLSNNNPISMARCHELFEKGGLDYKKVFEHEFVSADMKMLKPGRKIYETVVERIGLPAEEIMFIDDSHSNVDGAAAVGIKAVFCAQGADLKSTVETALKEAHAC